MGSELQKISSKSIKPTFARLFNLLSSSLPHCQMALAAVRTQIARAQNRKENPLRSDQRDADLKTGEKKLVGWGRGAPFTTCPGDGFSQSAGLMVNTVIIPFGN